jgi:hypothetical protein
MAERVKMDKVTSMAFYPRQREFVYSLTHFAAFIAGIGKPKILYVELKSKPFNHPSG